MWRIIQPKRWRISVDALVNVAILITCGIVVATVVQRRSVSPAEAAPPVFKTGERAEALPGVRYDEASSTLLMYVRSTCRYCTQSMPFYRQLRETVARGSVRLVAVSGEEGDVLATYLKQHGVDVDQRVTYDGRPVPTPTLVAVDRGGVIRDVWVGRQTSDGEARIMQRLRPQSARR